MFKVIVVLISVLVIIGLLVTVSLIAGFQFNQSVKKEVKEFFSNVEDKNEIIKQADLAGLPLCVQKWLEYSQVVGTERITTVSSKQTAVMRLKEGQRWMPVAAKQYFTIDEPGFIWKARIKAAPLAYIVGRDKYYEGKGHMLIKVLSLIRVADSKGKEIDQGSLIRYLAEIVWFPTAALSSYITWEEIDANSARATMSYKGVTGSGIFTFNEKGEVVNFTAERYGEFDGEFVLATWSIPMMDYKEFNGIRVPTKGEVTWKLATGDFNWYNFEVVDIEYNTVNSN
ncbi:MAG: DUF6544 family protein [Bacillota bacterium]